MAWKKFQGADLQRAFEAAFGIPYTEATPAMVIFFMKFSKYVRKFARNNGALYNYVQREFPDLKYKRVKVKSNKPDGKDWEALEISEGKKREAVKVELKTATTSDADEGDGEE